ncbi:hypothetical protein J437_LFUL009717 [Ladona fulva]|uniref:Uncharacterized protein n=1 Tax=Ladona fulva TaxID=123851 RepID=A0A8K0P1I3_LADFU|nr:hypothetical protein J437_LFUL009717 [Ladona fulva]
MANITLSNEQFQTLLAHITTMARCTESNAGMSAASSGNFSQCTSRFNGSDLQDVDTFLDCTNMTDENALRGLSMTLEGVATTWWQGVKATGKRLECGC